MSGVRRQAITIAIGSVSGFALELFGVPAGAIAGAMAGVAIAAVGGVDVGIGTGMRKIAFALLGVVLGTDMTPETIETFRTWPLSAVAMVACMAVLITVAPIYLRRVHSFDRNSAKIAAMPSAMSYSMALAIEYGLDVRRIAIMHTIRLSVLLIALPVFANTFLETGTAQAPASTVYLSLREIGLLGAIAAVMLVLSRWVKIPAFEFFGGMIVAGVLFVSGVMEGTMPTWVVLPLFLVTGCIVGSFFAGTDKAIIISSALAGLGNLLVGVTVCTLFAVPVGLMLDLPIVQVWLGFAPGGFETMIILAYVLGYDPAYVAGHQLIRFVLISVTIPFLLRRGKRKP
ncbi:MAG: AbrB family transcriptional regulator [Alphaproteobacteria bacterium]